MKYTKLLGSVALATLLATSFTACGSDSDNDDTPAVEEPTVVENTTRAYQRVASVPGTSADIARIADVIAQYVVDTDEATTLGFPSNWVIAGANPGAGETYETEDLLPIPVAEATSNTVSYKSRVIEFCNGAYATQATNTGQERGSALPCEVSVHSDGTNVYIDMLDASAIFGMFFPGTPDPEGALAQMAADVKYELRTMIEAALASEEMTSIEQGLGPVFTDSEIAAITNDDIYQVTKYTSTTDQVFTTTDAKNLAIKIIELLGTAESTADNNVEGLSEGASWRTGRPEPLAIPGVFVAEACSGKYAPMATRLGTEYITALPCEITTYLDRTDDTNKTIGISILDPNFMFEVMFKGAVTDAVAAGNLTTEEAAVYETLAATVSADLNKIADAAVAESGLNLQVAVAAEEPAVEEPAVEEPAASDLTAYNVFIYKNIDSTVATGLESVWSGQGDFQSLGIIATSSCTDYGFSGTPTTTTSGDITATTYVNMTTFKSCIEADYSGSAGSGTSNVGFAY